MATVTYEKDVTALLVIDSYNGTTSQLDDSLSSVHVPGIGAQ
jgi:hypothetical protein